VRSGGYFRARKCGPQIASTLFVDELLEKRFVALVGELENHTFAHAFLLDKVLTLKLGKTVYKIVIAVRDAFTQKFIDDFGKGEPYKALRPFDADDLEDFLRQIRQLFERLAFSGFTSHLSTPWL